MAGSNQIIAIDSRLRFPRLQGADSVGEKWTCVPQVSFVCTRGAKSWKKSHNVHTWVFQCIPLSLKTIGEVISTGTKRINVRNGITHDKMVLLDVVRT